MSCSFAIRALPTALIRIHHRLCNALSAAPPSGKRQRFRVGLVELQSALRRTREQSSWNSIQPGVERFLPEVAESPKAEARCFRTASSAPFSNTEIFSGDIFISSAAPRNGVETPDMVSRRGILFWSLPERCTGSLVSMVRRRAQPFYGIDMTCRLCYLS